MRPKINLDYLQSMADYITEYCHFFYSYQPGVEKSISKGQIQGYCYRKHATPCQNKKVIIYGFVLMNNHIHLLWQMKAGMKRDTVQRDFLKHTAQEIKNDMLDDHKDGLQQYLVKAKDRKYQFWERNALSVEIWTENVIAKTEIHSCKPGKSRVM